jgi:hypothetical protein
MTRLQGGAGHEGTVRGCFSRLAGRGLGRQSYEVSVHREGTSAARERLIEVPVMNHCGSVSSAEVIWTYLAHGHTYKRLHGGIAERLDLGALVYPIRLDAAADEMVQFVEAEVLAIRCDRGVLQTVRLFLPLHWRLCEVSAAELGNVWSILPGGFPPQGQYIPERQAAVSDLLPGWLAYLGLANEQARRDAETHHRILAEVPHGLSHRLIVRNEEGGRTVVGDGRHRLFAAYRHAVSQSGFTTLLYWGGQ